MRLVINGEERDSKAPNMEALVAELGMKGDRIAIELNYRIIPRPQWAGMVLADGDRLEIVHFVGGG